MLKIARKLEEDDVVGTWDVEDIVVSIRRLSGLGQVGKRGQYQANDEQSLELEYLIVSGSGSLAHSHGIKSHDDRPQYLTHCDAF